MTRSNGPQRIESVEDCLQRIAATPVEAVEPRLPELEARLRAVIDDDTCREAPVLLASIDDDRRRGERARRWVALAGAACIVALIAVAALARTSPTDEVVIASADSVSIVLPGGGIIDGIDGLVVPEGALIDVDGFVVIDGRRFGPGVYRITSDGAVVEVIGAPVPDAGVVPVDPGAGDGNVGSGDPDENVVASSSTSSMPTTTINAIPRTSVRQAVPTPRPTTPNSTVRPTTTERNELPPATRPPPAVPRTTEPEALPQRGASVPAALPTTATTTTPTTPTTTLVGRAVTEGGRRGGSSG